MSITHRPAPPGGRGEKNPKTEPNEATRVENLLRLAADFTPERDAPEGLAARALTGKTDAAGRGPAPRLSWWGGLGTALTGAAAAMMVVAVQNQQPGATVLPTPAAESVAREIAPVVSPAATPAAPFRRTAEASAPSTVRAAVPAVMAASRPAPVTASDDDTRTPRRSTTRLVATRSRGRATTVAAPSPVVRNPGAMLPAAGTSTAPRTVAAATAAAPRPLPPNTVSLDDEPPTIVPVVIAEENPDGSGVRMTPAVVALPSGSLSGPVTTE